MTDNDITVSKSYRSSCELIGSTTVSSNPYRSFHDFVYTSEKPTDPTREEYEKLKEKLAAYEAIGSVNYFKTLVEMQEALEDDKK